jgi:hypothetical protein
MSHIVAVASATLTLPDYGRFARHPPSIGGQHRCNFDPTIRLVSSNLVRLSRRAFFLRISAVPQHEPCPG